jgi:hypothetical protein
MAASEVIRVDDEGLQALASRCAAISTGLTTELPTSAAPVPGQATSAAVSAANTAVSGAAAALAGRVRATGTKAALATNRFDANDHDSARRIAAVGNGVVEV